MPKLDVTVVGELNLDLILYGISEPWVPEHEALVDRLALTLGSSSAIFAHNLAVMGSRVGFISRIGDDPLGRISRERLAEGGVDVSKVRVVSGPVTTGLTVILPRAQDRLSVTYPGTMFEMCFEDLDLPYLASAKHFHLSSFYLHRALRPRIAELFHKMKSAGLSTSLDTNDDPEDLWADDLLEVLRYVDVFLPNEREIMKITRTESAAAGLAKLASVVPTVVVKLGAQGAIARRGRTEVCAPSVSVAAVDPVGAGDSFNAGFIHQYVRGADLATCLRYGNLAGAFSTTKPGGTEAFRNHAQFQKFCAENSAPG
jgi:sugar/nucleoside kinase (ribokinase family)